MPGQGRGDIGRATPRGSRIMRRFLRAALLLFRRRARALGARGQLEIVPNNRGARPSGQTPLKRLFTGRPGAAGNNCLALSPRDRGPAGAKNPAAPGSEIFARRLRFRISRVGLRGGGARVCKQPGAVCGVFPIKLPRERWRIARGTELMAR